MADEITPEAEGTTQAETASAEPSGATERTFTQSEVNELIGKRLERERSKYAGFDEYKAKAEQTADYDEIRAERDKLKADVERRELIARVAASVNLPESAISLLSGTDEESLMAQAQALRSAIPAYPATSVVGERKSSAISAEDIRGIKDPRERIRARAEHIDLFK